MYKVLPGDSQDKPLVPVTIVNSGEIKPDQDQGETEIFHLRIFNLFQSIFSNIL